MHTTPHQNGKGDARRVSDERRFARNHTRSYGKTKIVQGRRTLVRVAPNGEIKRTQRLP